MRSLFLALLFAVPANAQEFTYRGFGEIQSTAYLQSAHRDDEQLAIEARFRLEPAYSPADWLTLSGSLDARLDTIEQVERTWRLDVRDRSVQRPALSLRDARATLRRSTLIIAAGRQFIRWGKADILNPTDRFAPRDFLEVTDEEFLAVIGVRAQYERGPHAIDVAWVPVFTPSRIPFPGGRWAPAPPQTSGPSGFVDRDPRFPDRSQYGARWNAMGRGFEVSLSYFDGFNHLPQFTAIPLSSAPVIALQRSYAPLRMGGADAALPFRWFTAKGEIAALFTTSDKSDDVIVYVIQVERQSGELNLVVGYAGEIVTERRATLAGAAIGGDEQDFIGQYRRNSHLLATLRYSF